MKAHCSSAVAPGTRLVVAMAPALTMGFMVRSSLSSMAITELKARPVALTPSFSRAASWPMASHTRAKTKGLEMLCSENRCWASPTDRLAPRTPTIEMPKSDGSASASAGM